MDQTCESAIRIGIEVRIPRSVGCHPGDAEVAPDQDLAICLYRHAKDAADPVGREPWIACAVGIEPDEAVGDPHQNLAIRLHRHSRHGVTSDTGIEFFQRAGRRPDYLGYLHGGSTVPGMRRNYRIQRAQAEAGKAGNDQLRVACRSDGASA